MLDRYEGNIYVEYHRSIHKRLNLPNCDGTLMAALLLKDTSPEKLVALLAPILEKIANDTSVAMTTTVRENADPAAVVNIQSWFFCWASLYFERAQINSDAHLPTAEPELRIVLTDLFTPYHPNSIIILEFIIGALWFWYNSATKAEREAIPLEHRWLVQPVNKSPLTMLVRSMYLSQRKTFEFKSAAPPSRPGPQLLEPVLDCLMAMDPASIRKFDDLVH